MAAVTWAVTLGGRTFDLRLVEGEADGHFALEVVGGNRPSVHTPVTLQHVHGSKYLIAIGNRAVPVFIDRRNSGYRVVVSGLEFAAEVEDARLRRLKDDMAGPPGGAGPVEITAPMPGLVVALEVAEGEEISRGQGVIIIESMKMENEIRSTVAGVVRKVLIEPGMTVEKDQPLLEVAPPG